jgi:hypothetical protein
MTDVKMTDMKTITPLDYLKHWLLYFAIAFAVGCPFIVFGHFFGGHWLALIALSISLATYFTLLARYANKKLKR